MISTENQLSSISEGHGIRGHLRLVCAPDSRGISILREQSFRAPIHLSKPHLDQDTLVLNVINPTAGLLEDDRIEQEVTVQSGGRLLLTSPSASRAHRVRNGWAAVSQIFRVKSGGFLEVLPEMFIPQAGAVYRQSTTLETEEGGDLLFFESLAPGRVASGEVFRYTSLDWRTDLIVAEQQCVRERYRIQPGSPSLASLQRLFPTAYYGSLIAVSTKLTSANQCWELLRSYQSPTLWIGQSQLGHPNAWSVKWIAGDAPTMRATQTIIRESLYEVLGRKAPDLRRVAGR